MNKSMRLRDLLRSSGRSLVIEPNTRGEATSMAGQVNITSTGNMSTEATGAVVPDTEHTAGRSVPDEKFDPLRRVIHRMGRRSRIYRLWKFIRGWALYFWALRPWRPLTAEERAHMEEMKRRKEMEKLLRSEARLAMRRITNALNRRGLCYRYKKSEKDFFLSGIQEVQFSEVALQPEALYLKIDTERLPRGVGILDLVQEHILTDLSLSVGRRVTATYSEKWGLWYIVERSEGARGIPAHVRFADMIELMPKTADNLTFPLGMTINSRRIYRSILDMPHLLIAGATDTGKSNMINVVLGTLIMRNSPSDLQLVLVDLKGGMEFSFYEGLPHLLANDVVEGGIVYHREQVPAILEWLVNEGERRMALLKEQGYKKLSDYNRRRRTHRLPYILLVIDEWADIKLDRHIGSRAEELLANLAQRMRAVGIHVILATQVPKREVISTLIKTNLPARMAFACPSYTASQLIIDTGDAKGLSPRGRYIYQKGAETTQIQAPLMPDNAIREIVSRAISGNGTPQLSRIDVTPEEIMEWALDNTDGRLTFSVLYQHFKGRIPQHDLRMWLQDWDGQRFTIRGRVYRIEPGEGSRPRRMVLHDA